MSAVLFVACDVGYGDEGKHGKKRQVEFRTAACSREGICGFPGVKIPLYILNLKNFSEKASSIQNKCLLPVINEFWLKEKNSTFSELGGARSVAFRGWAL